MKSKRFTVPYRRKREGKTNYKKRLRLLKSGKARLVVRRSLKLITAQIIEYHPEGDKVLVHATSKELEKMGWKYNKSNIPSSYLTGLLLGVKCKKNKVSEAILDLGLYAPIKGSKIFACIKGVVDAGINVPHSAEILPAEERVKGEHIASYNQNSSNMTKDFEDVKKKILSL